MVVKVILLIYCICIYFNLIFLLFICSGEMNLEFLFERMIEIVGILEIIFGVLIILVIFLNKNFVRRDVLDVIENLMIGLMIMKSGLKGILNFSGSR